MHDSLLPTHGWLVLSGDIVGHPKRLLRTVVSVVTLLLAVETNNALIDSHILWVESQNLVNLLLCLRLFLAVRRLMASLAAPVANEPHVHLLLPVGLHAASQQRVQLGVHPVFVDWEVCKLA